MHPREWEGHCTTGRGIGDSGRFPKATRLYLKGLETVRGGKTYGGEKEKPLRIHGSVHRSLLGKEEGTVRRTPGGVGKRS